MDTLKIAKGKTRMVAHRGLSGIEKENTLAAFIAAGNRSYFGIETDVHRTADGRFVCIHDESTLRVSGDALQVEESTYETVRSVRLTDRDGSRTRTDLVIPSLQEYIAVCKKYDKIAVLELKNRFSWEDLEQIVAIIEQEDYLSGVIFISFCLDNLIDMRAMLPSQPCQFLTSSLLPDLDEILDRYQLGLDIAYPALTRDAVERLHQKGVEINCWTCDTPEIAQELVSWGVDYITSNILE